MGMSNRAVPDSYRTNHTQVKNNLMNKFADKPDIRKYGEQMPAQPSFIDYQLDMAQRHGVEPLNEAEGVVEPSFGQVRQMNASPDARNYLQSLRNLLLHQDRPVEFE